MYKGIAGSEGIGIGKVVLIEEHDLTVEKKSVTDTDAELKVFESMLKADGFLDEIDFNIEKKDKEV